MSDSKWNGTEKLSQLYEKWRSWIYRSMRHKEESSTKKAATSIQRAKNTVANRYYILDKLGSGVGGQIFTAVDMTNNEPLVAKVASGAYEYGMLLKEYQIYSILCQGGAGVDGVTCPHYFGQKKNKYFLIMDRHGPSLEKIMRSNGSICIRGMLTIGIQALQRIQYIHSKGYVHRDVKPENMVVGLNKTDTLYFIDFGFAKKYIDLERNVHLPYSRRTSFCGTVVFSSRNADEGIEQSRRDDLESIGLVLVYLRNGGLPWSDIRVRDLDEFVSQVQEAKRKTSLESLCSGMPCQVLSYFRYVRSLRFEEMPNYGALIDLFLIALQDLPHNSIKEVE